MSAPATGSAPATLADALSLLQSLAALGDKLSAVAVAHDEQIKALEGHVATLEAAAAQTDRQG
ncbi:MAG TPA: hypothetical protein PLR99_00155 [Polyangiaceae bacterium]|nr:hypothetical protein [Polyangiaceae bacterium]